MKTKTMSPRSLDHALELGPSLAFRLSPGEFAAPLSRGAAKVFRVAAASLSRRRPIRQARPSRCRDSGAKSPDATFGQLRPAAGDLVLLPETG